MPRLLANRRRARVLLASVDHSTWKLALHALHCVQQRRRRRRISSRFDDARFAYLLLEIDGTSTSTELARSHHVCSKILNFPR
jgi:hypothetical protein